jgi:hypothetical protein
MSDTAKSIIGIVALLVGVPVGVLWLRDRVNRIRYRRRNTPERVAAGRRAFEERLFHPDWEFYERHLQRPAPAALRELYADRALLTAPALDYDDGEVINTFGALDERGLLDTREWLGFDAVAIATSDFGDPIYLRPGRSEPDTVYITHHDGGDTQILAESVASMLERLRRANISQRRGE